MSGSDSSATPKPTVVNLTSVLGAYPVTLRGVQCKVLRDEDGSMLTLRIDVALFGLEFTHEQWYTADQMERARKDGEDFLAKVGVPKGEWHALPDGHCEYR